MDASFRTRPAETNDHKAILALARITAEEGDAFAWDDRASDEDLRKFWIYSTNDNRGGTFIADGDDGTGTNRLAGICTVQGATGGRFYHVCYIAFAVVPAARGRGLGKRLCSHAVEFAKNCGYTCIRLDNVVTSNAPALRVCLANGFKVVYTMPQMFFNSRHGFIDTHVMMRDLAGVETRRNVPGVARFPRISAPVVQQPNSGVISPNSWALEYRRTGEVVKEGAERLIIAAGEEVQLVPHVGGMRLSPLLEGSIGFSVRPDLPEGFSLNPTTGIIYGTGSRTNHDSESQLVRVSATFQACFEIEQVGVQEDRSCLQDIHSMNNSMNASSPDGIRPARSKTGLFYVDEKFAAEVEEVCDVRRMLPEPMKARHHGDWMIWMVHRAWLNDPALTVLDFTNMEMPHGHIEKRIAPKLMQAIGFNTFLEVVSLSNSNMQKIEAIELAHSLAQNQTLAELNLEGNCLDSNAVRELAMGIESNQGCRLEVFRVSHQKQMGQFFGRPTEEAMGTMMERNTTIVKLGFDCDNPHWRNQIDRALLRNNDGWRHRNGDNSQDLPTAEELTLGHVLLGGTPSKSLSGVFPSDSKAHDIFRKYVEQTAKIPNTSQLQNFAQNSGTPLTYSVAAPVVKECRAKMLDIAEGNDVVVVDAFRKECTGTLRLWNEVHDQWLVDIWGSGEDKRYVFKTSREPSFSVSKAWVDALGIGRPRTSLSRGGA